MIIILSIIINLVAFPLYRQENKMVVISILSQLLIFIAVYNFISKLASLRTQSFLMISNLGMPDGMLALDGISVNILPVVMVLTGIISGMFYTRKQPLKAKILLCGIAIAIFVILYNSPAGLVIYWIMNNVFSLFKGIVGQLFNKKLTSGTSANSEIRNTKNENISFGIGVFFLLLLVGCIIPSNLIRLSVAEFIDTNSMTNPIIYVMYSCFLAIGTFVVWFGIYYVLVKKTMKTFCVEFVGILCVIGTVEYLFFGNNLGLISPELKYRIWFLIQRPRF